MSAKQATKSANAVATLYEGAFEITFDCVGVMVCKFARCSMMPIDGAEECYFREHGSCRHPASQMTTLEKLTSSLKKELKQLEEQFES